MTDEPIFFTPQARLLAAGWQPGDDMARVILQREALWAALAELSANVRSEDPMTGPLEAADRAGIVAAVTAHAVGSWCDGELQRMDSRAYFLNAHFRNALSKEIAKAPHAVLASLEGIEDPDGDAAAIRGECEVYLDASAHLFSAQTGIQVTAKANENYGEVMPRTIRPLVSRANLERAERLGKANRLAMTEATMAALTKR